MLTSYCKILLRHLRKTRFYAFINILGLGIGLAAMIWGIQVYRFNTSYDSFHVNRDQVFRVLITVAGSDGLKGTCPGPLAEAAVKNYLAVTSAVRWEDRALALQAAGNEPFSTHVNFTDTAFFDLFTFPLLRGEARLSDPSTVLLTETAAKKFFGEADPIGKTLTLYSDQSYKMPLVVSGILKDPPVNSSFQFETLTGIVNYRFPDGSSIRSDDWAHISDAVFLKLSDARQAGGLGKALGPYASLEQAARQDLRVTSFTLQSLRQTASESGVIDVNAMLERPADVGVYAPLILGMLVLLSACLNFANTTVAQSRRRLKEIGIRKVMGSLRVQIILQQLLECALIIIPAIGLAMLLDRWWLPAYNGMIIHSDLHASWLQDHTLQMILVALTVIMVLLAGAYPAFYISRFNATSIFRGAIRFGGRNVFSRFLLGLQIVITFITLVTSIAFARNAAFQRDYDYGYHTDNIIGVWLPMGADGKVLHDELSHISGVEAMVGARDQLGFSYHSWPMESEGKKAECTYLEAAPDYPDLMGLKLVAGSIPPHVGGKDNYDILVNEKLCYTFGWKPEEAIGRTIRRDDKTVFHVVGILKDFTQNSFNSPIHPLAMCLIDKDQVWQWVIRTKPGQLGAVKEKLKAVWTRLYPSTPLNTYFQDEVSANAIRLNAIITRVFTGFALISIFMAATGMFSLVSLTILKRLREIAIRKIVGADRLDLFRLVGAPYIRLFFIAALIGCSIGYLLAHQLMTMIFPINAGVRASSLLLSFGAILLLSLVLIATRIFWLSRLRTADVLKNE